MKTFNVKEIIDNTYQACALIDWTNELTHYVLAPKQIEEILQNAYKLGYDQALKDFQSME